MKAGLTRQVKLLQAWAPRVIEALVHTGGEEFAPPSLMEENTEKEIPLFLKAVIKEIRKILQRLNTALESGCLNAVRSAGIDVFYNLHQLAPHLDFKAVVMRVSSELKKNLPQRVVDAAEALVASRLKKPKEQQRAAPAAKGAAGGPAKGQAPPASNSAKGAAGGPAKGQAPPASTSEKGAAPPKPK